MPPNEEDFHTSAMVAAVRDMARELQEYKQHADAERKQLIDTVNATVEAMRKDFWDTTVRIQLDAALHRDEHSAERKERAADAVDRLNRQLVWNLWMGALTIMVVINLLLIGYVVVRVAQVAYGR